MAQEDYKVVNQNVKHFSTGATDQFYSNMDDDMKKKRIDSMFERDFGKEFKQFFERKN